MTRTELIIQILKVVIGLAFAAYFVWWSLQVLDRLTPEVDGPTAMVGRILKSNALLVGRADTHAQWLSKKASAASPGGKPSQAL